MGLSLNSQLPNSDFFEAYAFEKMKMLRFLQLDHVQMTGDYGYLSKQLRWIYWQGFPLESIPNNFYLKGAIVMDFQRSNLRLVWKEPEVYITSPFFSFHTHRVIKIVTIVTYLFCKNTIFFFRFCRC